MVKIRCPVCNGDGRVPESFGNPKGTMYDRKPKTCPACDGTGIQEVSDYAYMGHPLTIYKDFPIERDKYPFPPKYQICGRGR